MTPATRSDLRDWIRTALVIATFLATMLLAFTRLDAKADDALGTADRAETKAASVEADVKALAGALAAQTTVTAEKMAALNAELVRIRTVLEERLPRLTPAAGPR